MTEPTIEQLRKLHHVAMSAACVIVNAKRELLPQLLVVHADDDVMHGMRISPIAQSMVIKFHSAPDAKQRLARAIRAVLTDAEADVMAVVHVSEAWMAKGEGWKPGDPTPSERPDRASAVMVLIHTRGKTYCTAARINDDGVPRVVPAPFDEHNEIAGLMDTATQGTQH